MLFPNFNSWNYRVTSYCDRNFYKTSPINIHKLSTLWIYSFFLTFKVNIYLLNKYWMKVTWISEDVEKHSHGSTEAWYHWTTSPVSRNMASDLHYNNIFGSSSAQYRPQCLLAKMLKNIHTEVRKRSKPHQNLPTRTPRLFSPAQSFRATAKYTGCSTDCILS